MHIDMKNKTSIKNMIVHSACRKQEVMANDGRGYSFIIIFNYKHYLT